MRLVLAAVSALAAIGAAGCLDTLDPGQFGKFRYVGQVDGSPPLKLLPPTFDREGNTYVLYGSRDPVDEYQIFIGSAGGYWSSTPLEQVVEDPPNPKFGVHGWIGHSFQNVYYWAGDALINVDGFERNQFHYLDTDPNTQTKLLYKAIIPWVRDTPSLTTLVAYIQGGADSQPFSVLVNLRTGLYSNSRPFSPSSATDITFLGVGYDRSNEVGVVLVRYKVGDTSHLEARFFDRAANLVAAAKMSGGEDLEPYSIHGYLQANDSGTFAGLDDKGELVVLTRSGGHFRAVSGMTPVGVHKYDGQLWLVGTKGGPVVAPINDDGGIGKVQSWTASRTAASTLKQPIVVIDDRRLPSHSATWNGKNAMGPYPFVTEQNPEIYADGETGWLVAGPSYDFSGTPRTAIAFAPVGISYP